MTDKRIFIRSSKIIWLGTAILLIATLTRLWDMTTVPPGLQHDEVINIGDALGSFETGQLKLFYPNNYGREGLFIWIQGIAVLLFGMNPVAMKFFPLTFGLLSVALSYRIFGRIYGWRIGTISASLMAVNLWAVLTSRFALRAGMMPMWALLMIVGVYYLHEKRERRYLGAGLIILSVVGAFYTYTSGPALVLIYLAFLIYLALTNRQRLRDDWRMIAGILLIIALSILPMIVVRLTLSEGLERVREVMFPIQALQAGDARPLIENALRVLGMPFITGDPAWRYNVANRPLFLPFVGIFLYWGVFKMLWRRSWRLMDVLLIGIMLGGVAPAVVTNSAPAYLRSVIAMPLIMLFVAYGIWYIPFAKRWKTGLALAVIIITAGMDSLALYRQWMNHDEVQKAYLGDLRLLADYVARLDDEPFVFVTANDLDNDPNVYPFYRRAGSPDLLFFDGFANINLAEHPRYLFEWSRAPIEYENVRWLEREYGAIAIDQIMRSNGDLAYTVYYLAESGRILQETLATLLAQRPIYWMPAETYPQLGESRPYPIQFSDLLQIRAVDIPSPVMPSGIGGVNMDLYIQPLQHAELLTVQFFAHLVDEAGNVVAQRDLLGYPASQWHPDVISVQLNYIPLWEAVPNGTYFIALGLYDWQTGVRYPVVDAEGQALGDMVMIGSVQIGSDISP
jgi:4-amino-4-deoxy-L-arabinose transferase-like glycosyltransferase